MRKDTWYGGVDVDETGHRNGATEQGDKTAFQIISLFLHHGK